MQMYDVVPDSTIKELIQLSHSSLSRSLVVNETEEGGEPQHASSFRTSVEAYIKKEFPRLTSLTEAITGLSVKPPSSSEYYVVASYTSGGHYECHVDAVRYICKINCSSTYIQVFTRTDPQFDQVKVHVRDPSSNSMLLLTSSIIVPSFIILRQRVRELS